MENGDGPTFHGRNEPFWRTEKAASDSAVSNEDEQEERGREAAAPLDIPSRGWRDIFFRVWAALIRDHVSIIAAGVAFYGMLAVFPAITSLVSIYGLLADPADVQSQFASLKGIIPVEAWSLMNEQLKAVAAASKKGLGAGAALGVLVALWSGGAGLGALMTALNIAYREREKRSLLAFYATAVLFTFGILAVCLLSLGVTLVAPAVLGLFELGAISEALVKVTPWLVLALVVTFALGMLYRYGASRSAPKARWVSAGALLGTVLWILSSLLFSFYVSNFASYYQIYGSLGAVIILLMWFWISTFIVLLGAKLNAEMEHQTKEDTTEGKPVPMGQRGAFVADNVGDVP